MITCVLGQAASTAFSYRCQNLSVRSWLYYCHLVSCWCLLPTQMFFSDARNTRLFLSDFPKSPSPGAHSLLYFPLTQYYWTLLLQRERELAF